MPTAITALMLYDLVACPHRVTMDLYGDPAKRDEPNPFVRMLWERGSLYEREVCRTGIALPRPLRLCRRRKGTPDAGGHAAGRPKRDAMLTHLQSVAELAGCNPDVYITRLAVPTPALWRACRTPSAALPECPVLYRVGGPGRTRTCDQTVMSGQL